MNYWKRELSWELFSFSKNQNLNPLSFWTGIVRFKLFLYLLGALERRKLINSTKEFKLLDLGWGLDGSEGFIDSIKIVRGDFASAGAFYDFDAIFIDPANVNSLWTDYLRPGSDGSFRSNPSEDGGLSRGLLNLMRVRREEIKELLKENRPVFCKLRKIGHKLTVIRKGENTEVDSYSWLPNDKKIFPPEGEVLKKREGERLKVTGVESQLGAFLDSHSEGVSYGAVLDNGGESISDKLEPIAVTPSDDLASFVLNIDGGSIYFLPAEMDFDQSAQKELLEVASNLSGGQFGQDPAWLDDYSLKREEVFKSDLEKIEDEISKLKRKKKEKSEELNEVIRLKKLLSAGSDRELKTTLRKTLEGLRFQIEEAVSGIDLIISPSEGTRFAVKAGANRNGPLGLEQYHELVRGINDLKIYDNDDPQGVLVVNAYSETNPTERPEQITDELLSGCNLYGFTVVTSTKLFEVLKDNRGRDKKAAAVEELFQKG